MSLCRSNEEIVASGLMKVEAARCSVVRAVREAENSPFMPIPEETTPFTDIMGNMLRAAIARVQTERVRRADPLPPSGRRNRITDQFPNRRPTLDSIILAARGAAERALKEGFRFRNSDSESFGALVKYRLIKTLAKITDRPEEII